MGKQSESPISLHSKKYVQELLSALQHEIRNDITNIQSNSYFLFRKIDKPSNENEEYMQRITTKSDKILRQIYEMSDIFQILQKSFELNISCFNAIPFVEEIGELMKKLYPRKKLTLTTPAKQELMIEADKDRITMLLKRLIAHTNEYSHAQYLTGVELSIKDANLEIAIWPYEEDKKDFHKKLTRELPPSKKFSLLNIELALYEEIIKQHKGSIEFVRNVAGNQVFFITLPLHSLPS